MAGTCATEDGGGGIGGAGAGEIMLFGVRVVVDSMRKSVSLNNLSQYEQPQDFNNNNSSSSSNNNNNKHVTNSNSKKDKDDMAASGYASADDAVPHSSNARGERKRGVPWTEEEHKLFLLGLQKVGKGDWRGISRNFVKTRTPTQVASHAQKYFLRRSNLNRRRRRSSLFDITTDTVTAFPMEEEQARRQDNSSSPQSHPLPPPLPETSNFSVMSMPAFSMTSSPVVLPIPIETPMQNLSLLQANSSTTLIRPIAVIPAPPTSGISDINLNLKASTDSSPNLSLKLSLPSDQRESPSSTRYSAFQVMPSFNNGDGIITVA
ncbi:transcription factor MYB1R1 [Ricinus communis]|uniref:DNA binding protein, putative n=1 Tax=Ricinus communis TaxID=3988 RepID=B9R903_RICCO|nr:transcription factor MYB1R1 [Ricinus communis]EEF52080.1 DNA binding protein, putative [Ricinus communis]|eukprot:XP_002511478.1 transcription factor MYB1R1 [Ricinus communis]